MKQRGQALPRAAVTAAFLLVVGIIGYLIVSAVLGYWLEGVDSREIAVQFRGNQPVAVVGPGLHTDLSPFADIKRVKISNLGFCAVDGEVIAADQQPIGVHITGDVLRPGIESSDFVLGNWSRLSSYWQDDTALVGDGKCQSGLMANLSRQAAKVCVGSKPAMQSVIGEARDVLRACVDENLDALAKPYGLTVVNIVVPNVELSQAVRTAMDNITNARYAVQLEEQEKLRANASADRELAVRQGQIKVIEGQAQEEARQRATLAELTRAQLLAQRAVLEQQASNDLYSAQQALEIERTKAQAAAEAARSTTAPEAARAAIFQSNPAYANAQNVEKAAAAIKQGDKLICEGACDPTIILGDAQPLVQTQSR